MYFPSQIMNIFCVLTFTDFIILHEDDDKYICRRYFILIYLYCSQIFQNQINDFSRT